MRTRYACTTNTAEQWNSRMDFHMTPEQLLAARFLESRGFRFLVHFGYENAIEKALELASDTVH